MENIENYDASFAGALKMKKNKYSHGPCTDVLKYLQESRKSIYVVATFLGIALTLVPMTMAFTPQFTLTMSNYGKSVNAVNNAPNTTFTINATLVANGTTIVNLVGAGGNDTFNIYGSNITSLLTPPLNTIDAVATGVMNNTFHIISGSPSGGNSSSFSLMSGPHSFYNITENNINGTTTFAITGGAGSKLVENSSADEIIGNTVYSVNLGFNSTVILGTDFQGANDTTFNVIF